RKPLRSVPWWLLGGLVLLMVFGVWIGTRWGTQIGTGVSTMASFLTRSDAEGEGAGHDSDAPTQYYTCGMHPSVILPEPGDCPICGMALTPLDPSKFTGELMIDPVVVQNIGVRIEPVVEGPLVRTIRTIGMVDYDETRVRDVNTKLSGWIEKLYVDYEGVAVEAGDPLFEVYSPALLAAEEEYLLALRARGANGNQPGALDLVGSARMKLELYDITPEQIDALAASGKAERTMTLLSPHTGVVIAKHANEGMQINPGMQVFRIADLSKVWVLVTLYESQLPFVSLGQNAVMSLPYIPGHTFEGKVVYIYPYLDTKTREVQVRLEFENENGLLMPGMFATVELQSTLRQRATLVPREAVISTGTRNVAFVSLGEGKFEPRDVKLGVETGTGNVEVLDGLKPGEMVVTSGQFLIDSESRVREALAKMIRGEMASDQVIQAASAGSSELTTMSDAMAAGLSAALDAYFAIGDRLASDTPSGIDEPARALAAALDSVIGIEIPENEHFWHEHTEAATIRGSALELVGAADLAMAREHFGDISVAMDTLMRATGIPPGYATPVQSLHCPMFREGQGGGIWLQPEGPVRNPFFGAMMLRCYDGRETIPTTGQAAAEEPAAADKAPPAETVSVSVEEQ
ncbi:Probable Co/Zn/Cd efflux system membrane fusion protein, partial [hydrothermal vent metagenome]